MRRKQRRSGFILLLALLILFAVVVVAAGLSRVAFSGLNIASDTNDGVAAYFGAESAIERGLWYTTEYRRTGRLDQLRAKLATLTGASGLTTTDFTWRGNISVSNPTAIVVASLPERESVTFDLFDPDDLQSGLGATTLKIGADVAQPITATSPEPWLEVALAGISLIGPDVNTITPVITVREDTPSTGAFLQATNCTVAAPCEIPIDAGLAYRVRVTARYAGLRNVTAAVNAGGPDLPILGQLEIKGTGLVPGGVAATPRSSLAVSATLNLLTPASPLFDYTLSSQDVIDKR